MRTRPSRPAGAALAAIILAGGTSALAGGPSCRDTLPPGTETTLTADLECLGGTSVLTVDAATLNLNGFSITCLNPSTQTNGVVLTGKHATLNGPGNIIGCDAGVLATGEGKHSINDVHVDSAEGIGIVLLSDKNLVTNTVASGESGIRVFGDKNAVLENQITTALDGIDIFGSRNRITFNQLTGNEDAVTLRASKNKLTDNTVTDPSYGLTVEGDGHVVSNNQISSAEFDGIRVTGGAKILENSVVGSGGIGIDVSSPADARVKVIENDVSGSGDTDLFDATSDCGEHRWSGNTFSSSSPESCIE